jgi:hypothetical protein
MAEPTQYNFELKESLVALIKEQGIHEGLWSLGIELTMGAGSFGPTPAEARPGAFMQINKLQLIRQTAGTPEAATAVDAAIVNPAPPLRNNSENRKPAIKGGKSKPRLP